ncbi:hypothetical protein [Streptomyces tardus]|uniref:hypothetical protein n=1 Tax=Streptomyces tardus TaxID=2780544 RepID=UPI001F46B524|nr:hypothetical protein [Streptomyces tardus]
MRTSSLLRPGTDGRRHGYRALRTAAVAVAACALALTTSAAGAAPKSSAAPGFLDADELPAHPGSQWYAGEVADGLPEIVPFCVDGPELPAEGASHRLFHTDLDTGASQVSFTAGSEQSAQALAAQLRDSSAGCAADWLRDNPGGTASWRDLGNQDVGDGAHSYGVHIESAHGSQDVHLFGVGRDGSTVTVVAWGQMGTLADAPVEAYRTTLRTAVEKLAG